MTTPANTLTDHYKDYFASAEQLDWYRLMAVDKAENVIRLSRHVPHDRIIDIGAGDGAVLNRLDELEFGSKLFAVDISESGLQSLCAKKWKHLVECKPYDGYNVPYPDDSFDLAVLSHVIEHVEHPRMLLREAARVAKHVFLEVPLEYNRTSRKMKQDFKLDALGHINFFDARLIRLLVQSSGLRVLNQEIRHFTPKAYTRHQPRKGLIKYWIKELAYRINPQWASGYFWYHCALLCTRDSK